MTKDKKDSKLSNLLTSKIHEKEKSLQTNTAPAPQTQAAGQGGRMFTMRLQNSEVDKIKQLRMSMINDKEVILSESAIVKGIINYVKPSTELQDFLLSQNNK